MKDFPRYIGILEEFVDETVTEKEFANLVSANKISNSEVF